MLSGYSTAPHHTPADWTRLPDGEKQITNLNHIIFVAIEKMNNIFNHI